jgi:hypothetical protein
MKENEAFRYMGIFPDFQNLLNKVLSFNDLDWGEYKGRKNTGGIASYHTETIPLKYSPKSNEYSPEKHQHYEQFSSDIMEICKIVGESIGQVSETSSMLTRMNPGGIIKPHKDQGLVTRNTHRIHIPIVTNSLCFFTVGGISMNLKPGEIWVIDNTDRVHKVDNGGSTHRIHMIVDAG